MSTFNEAAIRKTGAMDSAALASLLAGGPRGKLWSEDEYWRASWVLAPPWALLIQISKTAQVDIFAVCEQTTSSVFEYHHYVDGRQERGIAFDGDGWVEVQGTAEEWERRVLFTIGAFDSAMEEAQASGDADWQQFRTSTLKAGSSWPRPRHAATVELFRELGIPLRAAPGDALRLGKAAYELWFGFAGCCFCFASGIRHSRLDVLGIVGFAVLIVASTYHLRQQSYVVRFGGGILVSLAAMLVTFLIGRVFG